MLIFSTNRSLAYLLTILSLLFTISTTNAQAPSDGRVYHFDPSSLSGDVSSWSITGEGGNPNLTFTGDAGYRPTILSNGVSGNKTIQFNNSDYLYSTTALPDMKSVYIVFKIDGLNASASTYQNVNLIGGGSKQVILSAKDFSYSAERGFRFNVTGGGQGFKYSLDFNETYTTGTSASGDSDPKWSYGTWHILELEFTNATIADLDLGDYSKIFIGALPFNNHGAVENNTFQGEIAEIIVYDKKVDDVIASGNTLHEDVETYLDSKYNLYSSRVWYTTTGGGYKTFTDANSWTTSSNGVGGTNGVPLPNDEIHILGGQTVTATADNLYFSKMVVEENGILDLGETTGHNFQTIQGSGTITLKTNDIPLGYGLDPTVGFYSYDAATGKGGTLRFEGGNDIVLNSGFNYEFGNVEIDINGNNFYAQDLDINGDLNIVSGNFVFGDFSGATYVETASTLNIGHSLSIATNGGIDTHANDTQSHIININKDFLNEGNVDAPKLSLRAIDEVDEQKFEFNGATDIYQVYVNKGLTSRLSISANSSANLTLGNDGKGLTIVEGILNTGGGIRYDFNNASNSSYSHSLPEAATLEIGAGSILTMSGGFVFYVSGKINLDGGIFDIYNDGVNNPTMGIVLRELSQLEVNSGTLKSTVIRPTVGSLSAIHRGSIKLYGGTTHLYGTSQAFYTLVLPFSDNSFEMYDGAELNIYAENDKGIHIDANPENVNVEGGEINIFTTAGNNFILNSSAPLYNVNTYGDGTVKLAEATYSWSGNNVVTPANDLYINGSLNLAASKLDGNNKDLYIKKNLILSKEEPFVYTGIQRNTGTNQANWFQSSVNWINFIGNDDSELNVNYAVASDVSFEIGNVSLGNFRINKDTQDKKVTLVAHSSFAISDDTEATIGYHENESNLIDFEGDFELLSGIFDHRNYSVRLFRTGATVKNFGTFGIYDGTKTLSDTEGTAGVQALLKFREGDVTIETTDNAVFGNVRIYLEDHTLSFTSDVKFNRVQYVSGTVDLQDYQLTIDRFTFGTGYVLNCPRDGDNNLINAGCEDAIIPRFGTGTLKRSNSNIKTYNNFFVTNGKASSGGLRLKVDNNRTDFEFVNIHDKLTNKKYTASHDDDAIYMANSRRYGGIALHFPVAIRDDNSNYIYTPASVVLTNVDDNNSGYISVSPALSQLPTANQDSNDELLGVYWNVKRSSFTEDATLPTVRWFFEIPNDFGSGLNPFTSNSNDLTDSELEDLVPGKVLDNDSYIRQNNANVSSTYERISFDAPEIDANGDITNPTVSDIKRDIMLMSRWDGNLAFNPLDVYQDKLVFAFEENYDGSDRFVLENANYTVGHPTRFDGAPRIMVYQNKLALDGDGKYQYNYGAGEGDNSWDNPLNWYVLDESKYDDADALTPIGAGGQIPTKNDVVILGTEDFDATGIIINTGKSTLTYSEAEYDNGLNTYIQKDIEVAELKFEHSERRRGNIEVYGGDLKIGKVTGAGELALNFGKDDDQDYFEPKLIGDFGEWTNNPISILKLMFPFRLKGTSGEESITTLAHAADHGATALTKMPQLNLSKLPIVELHSGACYFDYDFEAEAIEVRYRGTLYIDGETTNGNITLNDTLRVHNDGAIIFGKEGSHPKTINAGTLFSSQRSSEGVLENQNYIYIEQGIATTPVHHTLNVSKNLKINDILYFDLYGGGINDSDGATDAQASKVTLNFTGDEDASFEYPDAEQRASIELYDVSFNRGKSTTFTIQDPFTIAKTADGDTEEKPFLINSGTVVLEPSSAWNVELNSGGEEYYIPSDAGLIVKNNATVTISSTHATTGGMLLDGLLEVDGGTVDFDEGSYNYISYGISGNAMINVKAGEFVVGGQVRRVLNNDKGALHFYQSGGTFTVGGQTLPSNYNQKAIFEIVDDGSINLDFTYDESNPTTSFTIKGSTSYGANDVSLLLTPTTQSLSNFYENEDTSLPSRILIEGDNSSTFSIHSTLPLGDTEVKSGTVKVLEDDLYFSGDLLINAGTTFEQGIKDVWFDENIYNSGTYEAENTTTYFNKATQYLYDRDADGSALGVYNFGNVKVTQETSKLIITYAQTENGQNGILINGNLELGEGARIGPKTNDTGLIQSDIYLLGDLFLSNGTISNDNSGNGKLYMAGTSNQIINSEEGTIYSMVIDNTNHASLKDPDNEDLFLTLTIENCLQLKSGNLQIDENTLIIEEGASITGATNASTLNDFSNTSMIEVTDRNRNGGVYVMYAKTETKSSVVPLGVGSKFTPIELDLTTGATTDNFGVSINVLNEIPVKSIEEGLTQADARIIDFGWYINMVKSNSSRSIRDIPTGVQLSVNLHYNDEDIINGGDETTYLPSVNVGNAFYDFTVNDVYENDNYGTVLINAALMANINALLPANLQESKFESLMVIGHPDDIADLTPIFRTQPRQTMTQVDNDGLTELAWNSTSSWQRYDYSLGSYEALQPTDDVPGLGAIVRVRRGTAVVLDQDVELSEITIEDENTTYYDGKLIIAAGSEGASLGKVDGKGLIIMRIERLIDDNWSEFLTLNNGGVIMDITGNATYTDVENKNGDGSYANDFIEVNAATNVAGINELTLVAPDNGLGAETYPVYTLNSNLTIGDKGLTVNDGTTLIIGNNNEVEVEVMTDLTLKKDPDMAENNHARLYINGGSKLVIHGNFIAEAGTVIKSFNSKSGEKEFVFKKDITFESGVVLSDNDLTFILDGTTTQHVQVGNTKDMPLKKVVVMNTSSETTEEAIQLQSNLFVGEELDLTDGKIASNGFLFHRGAINYDPDAVVNKAFASYITGLAHFLVEANHEGATFFPVGNLADFHPIGVGQIEQKDPGFSHKTIDAGQSHIVWQVEYVSGKKIKGDGSDLDLPADINTVYTEGHWELNPITVGETLARQSEEFTTHVNFIFDGKLDGYAAAEDVRLLYHTDGAETWDYLQSGEPDYLPADGVIQSTPITFYGTRPSGGGSRLMSNARTLSEVIGNPGNDNNIISVSNAGDDLPVELVYFEGELADNGVTLSWSTAAELNNEGFYIEVSIDGRNYEEIAFVEGQGNSNITNNYSYIHERPYGGQSYYRLVQVDFDGQYEIFGPVVINNESEDTETVNEESVLIYPNPNNGDVVNIQFTNFDQEVQVVLMNNNGLTIESITHNPSEDPEASFGVRDLPSGMYLIKVIDAKKSVVKKLIIR